MAETVLLVGATGMLGVIVARRLRDDGVTVRCLSRDPDAAGRKLGEGFEIVRGDPGDPVALAPAVSGCDAVHIHMPAGLAPELEPRYVANVAGAARAANVRWLGYLSGTTVSENNAWFPPTRARLDAEAVVKGCGIPGVIFRAAWFMESLPRFVRGQQAMLFGHQPHPIHWVAAADFARMVSAAICSRHTAPDPLTIHGPSALTMGEALAQCCDVLRPGARVKAMPYWLLTLIALLGHKSELKHVIRLMRYFEVVPEAGDPGPANALLGAPTTTLGAWLNERRTQASADVAD